jgi:Methyltransferase domain
MDISRLSSYVLEDNFQRRVTGWLNEGAISCVIAFGKWQDENNILGDVAEIGVHHGKFFVLLANLRRQHERAFAVDVFDDQHLNPDNSGRGDLVKFKEHLRSYTDEIGITIIAKDSQALTRGDFYRSRRGNVRLFSVDGSHTADHTASDLATAAQLLAAQGLIILDDFYNPDWPGVQEGFHRYLASTPDVVPFAYGNNKLYMCKAESHARYLDFVENDLRPFLTHYKRVTIGSSSVTHIAMPTPELVFQPDFRLIPNVFPLRERMMSSRVSLGTGWARLQPNGIWTVGPCSELSVRLTPGPDKPSSLCIDTQPFLHPRRSSRRLSVTLNHHKLGDFVFDETTPNGLQIPLPPEILQAECDLQFDIEGPDRPSEAIGTHDDRPLGFFFRQIRIS